MEINGADQFVALARRLKEAGEKDLQRELNRGIANAVKPLKDALKKSARQSLPQRGGLAERVAQARVTTRKAVGSGEGIRVQAGGKKSQLKAMDQGRFRHPVYGDRKTWVQQNVDPGWWSDPVDALAPEVKRALEAAISAVARKVAR